MVRCRGGGVFGEEAKKQIVIVTATNHSLGMQKGVIVTRYFTLTRASLIKLMQLLRCVHEI